VKKKKIKIKKIQKLQKILKIKKSKSLRKSIPLFQKIILMKNKVEKMLQLKE
jgi:hypothetical protein